MDKKMKDFAIKLEFEDRYLYKTKQGDYYRYNYFVKNNHKIDELEDFFK